MSVHQRRTISNDEFISAYSNVDNIKIIRSILKKYEGLLEYDELEQCGKLAIWKTLQCHQDSFGQKFTTSLYNFVVWECRVAIRKHLGRHKIRVKVVTAGTAEDVQGTNHSSLRAASDSFCDEDMEHILECLYLLSKQNSDVIRHYYFDRLSMKQIAVKYGHGLEWARTAVYESVELLRELCHNTAGKYVEEETVKIVDYIKSLPIGVSNKLTKLAVET